MLPISTYKNKIASRYIPVDASNIANKIIESEYYLTSIKHDGHLVFLVINNGEIKLYNRSCEELKIDSIIDTAVSIKQNCIIVGELCCFVNNASTSHRDVNSAISNPNKFDLRFGAFDLLEYNGEDVNFTPIELNETLKQIITTTRKEIFVIEQIQFEGRKEVESFFESAINNRAEGVIVKIPGNITYKIKQIHHIDLVVLGYAESEGQRKGLLRELLLGFVINDNQYQVVTKCGSGFSDREREELFNQLKGLTTNSDFTEVSGAKTAFNFVKPEMIVEISCLDFINENSNGPIRKALLTYEKGKGYLLNGHENTLSIISPNFICVRKDKKTDKQDAGTLQAYSLCEPIKQLIDNNDSVDSEIIIREVFTKNAKGGTAVRKFLGLKTNKESSGFYSPFLVVYTDFSAERKSPLEQEIFLCSTESEMKLKIQVLKEENIKKGWEVFK